MNVVGIFETACADLGIIFRYGTEAVNNILNEGDIADDDFVLLLESPINKSDNTGEYGTTGTKRARSRFILAKSSELDNTIYNENGSSGATSKYTLNVVPCEVQLELLRKKVQSCNGILSAWSYEDVYNVFDFNIDGVFVNFELTYDE